MEQMNPDIQTPETALPAGQVFLHLALVVAVLLSGALGILLVMRDTGKMPFPLPQPGGGTPAPVVAVHTRDDGETEDDGRKEDRDAGTDDTSGSDDVSAQQDGDGDAAGTDASGETPSGRQRRHAKRGAGAETRVSITFADATLNDRISGLHVMVLEGHDNPDGDIVEEGETDGSGNVMLALPDGAYTLVWEKAGYLEDYDNLTVSDEAERAEYYRDSQTDYVYWKWILPVMQENGAYIVMEWKSAEDLDLCVFNAQTKEYISIINPMDSYGNFLYYDRGSGSPGMEVVKINDISGPVVYAPYVRDGNNLRRGAYSAMEATGVRVSVYSGTRLLTRQEADASERAGLWNPCYLYEGNVYQEGAYIYDPGKYMWAAFEK